MYFGGFVFKQPAIIIDINCGENAHFLAYNISRGCEQPMIAGMYGITSKKEIYLC